MLTYSKNTITLMELEFYLDSHGIQRKDFAKRLGISLSSFGYYRSGQHAIPLPIALKIELLTEGKVTVYDLAHLYKINPSK